MFRKGFSPHLSLTIQCHRLGNLLMCRTFMLVRMQIVSSIVNSICPVVVTIELIDDYNHDGRSHDTGTREPCCASVIAYTCIYSVYCCDVESWKIFS